MSSIPTLSLTFGLHFDDLYRREGLIALDHHFLDHLRQHSPDLHARLLSARAMPESLLSKDHSTLLLELAPLLEDFIAQLFSIERELNASIAAHRELEPIYRAKRLFIQRRVAKSVTPDQAKTLNGRITQVEMEHHLGRSYDVQAFAEAVCRWLEDETANTAQLTAAARFAAWVLYTPEGQRRHGESILYHSPKKLDPNNLVPVETIEIDGVRMLALPHHHRRQREGFHLTDQGANLEFALDHANYCIYCHNQGKDSCSKGFREKDGSFRKNAQNIPLAGCPLEEKISEMNLLKSQGVPIGALAMVCIDNPMAAGTGHRICNDCMKSCIYQKQEPVNIPQVETRTLKDVLSLPWGVEIYSLLTRWNPLNIERPLPRPSTGHKILVVGQGPAGYTLAHHLINDGHAVLAIDGLKIEPLAPNLAGETFLPIHDVNQLMENLATRTQAGFGGVAEYGITVRWNKAFLTLIRLLLERRQSYRIMGGIRLGSNITVEDAWSLGIDHIALCLGAGRPTLLDIPNGMARGVRAASDFLMSLQLTGASKADSLANLQLRLPVVVIGGGLTAIDTATESLAYYPIQVERFLSRYETLAKRLGESKLRQGWSAEDTEIATEWLTHARAIRAERTLAQAENRLADIQTLLDSWGGATVAYRRRLQDAPSYRLNHEEVELAMQEGIRFAENLTPLAIDLDTHGAAQSIRMRLDDPENPHEITLPARSILIAAGTQPNTVLAREWPKLSLDRSYFQAIDENGRPVTPERIAKPTQVHVLMYRENTGTGTGRTISFFGDLHPSYAGNVVKAMASAKQGYPYISDDLMRLSPSSPLAASEWFASMNAALSAHVAQVNRLTPTIIEVILKAPMAARNFRPGQFFRLQNYEANAPRSGTTPLTMEGLALTGAWADPEQGLLSTIVLEMGGSSDLCKNLQPGEPVILMGPTGAPTHIPAGETVLLAGGGLGNAVLFSIGKAMRANGCKVIYFAGYKHPTDRFKQQTIEEAADCVVWCCDQAPGFAPSRPQDKAYVGNIVQAMRAYADNRLGKPAIPLSQVDRLIAIGSDRMMAAVAQARHTILKDALNPNHTAIGSINSPMQCMMKEICAQCLQLHTDPITGQQHYVFTCFEQDQPLDCVSFPHLATRLSQNRLPERQTTQWLTHLTT